MPGQQQEENSGARSTALRLVQITDSHLFESPDALLGGMNSQESFAAVIQLIGAQQGSIDAIVCTGDISQDGQPESYRRFHRQVSSLGAPQRWIPGNHDSLAALRQTLGANSECLNKALTLRGWRIVLLDSSVEGQVHGALTLAELDFLDSQLAECGRRGLHALVCLHHNPLPVAAQWLQRHALQNSEDLFAVLDRHACVRAVLWGHVHQEVDKQRNGVRMLASPSTCLQFHPERMDFTLDHRNPGYRWLALWPDGSLDTAVERVTERVFEVDFSSSGY